MERRSIPGASGPVGVLPTSQINPRFPLLTRPQRLFSSSHSLLTKQEILTRGVPPEPGFPQCATHLFLRTLACTLSEITDTNPNLREHARARALAKASMLQCFLSSSNTSVRCAEDGGGGALLKLARASSAFGRCRTIALIERSV